MKLKYSGKKSSKFWKKISQVKDFNKREELYSLSCELQNLEEKVLRILKKKK